MNLQFKTLFSVFTDYVFGRCLPGTGDVDEEDVYR